MEILKYLFAVILPPVGVAMQVGFTLHFWINLILTFMGYVPGLVHALWVLISDVKPPTD